MSSARIAFCDRVATIRSAIGSFGLQDKPPSLPNAAHNKAALLIRCGLSVQCFNIFEDFIKARTVELTEQIELAGVAFCNLPESMREAATIDAAKALIFQLKLQDKPNRIIFTQDNCEQIASTKGAAFKLVDLSFYHAGSNISSDQFRDTLSSFSIDKPWALMSDLCSRVGTSGLPAENVFKSLSQRRHQAAHDPGSTISEVDLLQSITDATGLALCYDALLTLSAAKIKMSTAPMPAGIKLLTSAKVVKLRFLKEISGTYRDALEGAKSHSATHKEYSVAYTDAMARSNSENSILVSYDSAGVLTRWDM